MAAPVNPPRGMRDLLPVEKAKREHALAVIRAVYRSHGFDEIEAPALEDWDRLHAGLGGDNEKLSFSVLRRGIGREQLAQAEDVAAVADLGLRYDLTVPLARFYATNQAALPTVFRAVQIGPVWRAERPQKGRYRQFVQCDIDILGEAGPIAELELIGATAAALDALGIEGASVRVNDRRILNRLLLTWGVEVESASAALITIDKLDKIGVAGVVAELGEQGVDTAGLDRAFGELATAGWDLAVDPPAWLDVEAYTDLLALKDALPEVELVFDPTLVRGMGYYTGTIFEIAHPSSTSSLGGGGRYDGMIGRFLGREVPAVGFSIGFERIIDLLPDRVGESVATALLHDADVPASVLLAAKRRVQEEGGRVRLERARKNRRAQLDALAADGFTRFATVTADGVGELRDLS
ncbi:histidine--tRNA ligase [Amnibacterium kyonggiense]|uniref:Histidine--tRNA ligase n=1 Tax=Amnibacterium kyonggiense TaxID=595671 RepID=A0A4R7FSC3_9MICO|nr:histidine--tRNA ligase [Amnibacterium kyonggiense]TDS80751.1 histidyl-tRNA synthetase [Amnibacterium kyonggiense]